MKTCKYCKVNPTLSSSCTNKTFYNYRRDFCSKECFQEFFKNEEDQSKKVKNDVRGVNDGLSD